MIEFMPKRVKVRNKERIYENEVVNFISNVQLFRNQNFKTSLIVE